MDKKNYYKKLAEIIDSPIDRNDILTKRFGVPMKKITYRECAIEHLKQGNLCKAYTDYILCEMAKLERIEQIIEDYDGSTVSMIKQFSEIQKVLDKE